MPVTIRKKKGRKCYSVTTPHGIKSRCTSRKKAEAQERILNAYDKTGWRPTSKRSRGRAM